MNKICWNSVTKARNNRTIHRLTWLNAMPLHFNKRDDNFFRSRMHVRSEWCETLKATKNVLRQGLWHFSFRVLHKIQFQGHFMKHNMLSWNTFTLVSNFHCLYFSSTCFMKSFHLRIAVEKEYTDCPYAVKA